MSTIYVLVRKSTEEMSPDELNSSKIRSGGAWFHTGIQAESLDEAKRLVRLAKKRGELGERKLKFATEEWCNTH